MNSVDLTRHFLIAMPAMVDPHFAKTLTLVCEHNENGALGIIINRPTDMNLHGLLEQVKITPETDTFHAVPVHFGGPVEPRRGFVLHEPDWGGQDTIHVAGRWALSGTIDVLRAIAEGTGPSRWLVALGYAGWGEGQLDEELTRHGWFNTPADIDLLYGVSARERWARGFAAAGIDPRLLASSTGTA